MSTNSSYYYANTGKRKQSPRDIRPYEESRSQKRPKYQNTYRGRNYRNQQRGDRRTQESWNRSQQYRQANDHRRSKERPNENAVITRLLSRSNTVEEVLLYCQWNMGKLNYINISSAFSRIAKLSNGKPCTEKQRERISQLIDLAITKMSDFDPRNITNTTWALAKLGIENKKLFETLAKEAMYKVRGLKGQEIASMAWGFAKLGIKNEKLFEALAEGAMKILHSFESKQMVNMAWAFATLGFKNAKLFKALSEEVKNSRRRCKL